jgi:hypothetical protein
LRLLHSVKLTLGTAPRVIRARVRLTRAVNFLRAKCIQERQVGAGLQKLLAVMLAAQVNCACNLLLQT